MITRALTFALLSGLFVAGQAEAGNRHHPAGSIELKLKGAVALGQGVAEISAFDPKSKRLFVIDGSSILKIVDLSDPSAPAELPGSAIDIAAGLLADLGIAVADANSVAVRHGIVAVAVAADPVTDPGYVAFYRTDGTYKFSCKVGALPDMLTFTPDGKAILVANEGEPRADVDPAGSVSIIDFNGVLKRGHCNKPRAVRTAGFEYFDGKEDALCVRGVRLFPGKSVSRDVEPEYIAVSRDSRTAWVTLQEANSLALVDIRAARVVKILPLGLKNHAKPGNGLDASDRDGGINIANWPVLGMYMPDTIAAFAAKGRTWLVTANEGDDRGENARIKDLVLDPAAFPNAADLNQDAALGRLNVSTIDGDTDGDGDHDRLHAYGARSFTIWDSSGGKVYDSGDLIERKIAELAPAFFNADNGNPDDFDTRSDNKGPEPEGVAIGEVGGRTYAFVGLERAGGGIMAFDVSDPRKPAFVQYVRRDEDVSPEGLLFIGANDSPSRKPLLVVSHELSGTVTVYEIVAKRAKKPGKYPS